MRCQPRTRRRRRGFTLIEMMVAMALLSIMGVMTFSSLITTIDAQDAGRTMQERYHAARVTLERMRREISMAYVSLHQAEDQRTQTLFDGEGEQIIFNTMAYEPFHKDAHESDQLEVEYRLERADRKRGDGQEQVIVRRVKHYVDDRPGKGGYDEVMVRGVKKLEFEYFDSEKDDWRDDWSVIVDDAVEMREKVKLIEQAREDLKTDSGQDDVLSAAADTINEAAVDKAVDEASEELLDDVLLPDRVKIRLILEDDDGYEYLLETQADITMKVPLYY